MRPAVEADVEPLAAVHVAAWRESFRHLLSERYLAEVSLQERIGVWRQVLQVPGAITMVAEADSGPVGFGGARTGAEGPRPLQLWGLYLLAAWHGSGVAQRLLDATIGRAPCFLWSAADNPRAEAFYRRNGFSRDGATDTLPSWEDMPIVRMVR